MNKLTSIRCSWLTSLRTQLPLSQHKNLSNNSGVVPARPVAEMYPGAPLSELLRASVVYNIFRSDYLVDNSAKVRVENIIIARSK